MYLNWPSDLGRDYYLQERKNSILLQHGKRYHEVWVGTDWQREGILENYAHSEWFYFLNGRSSKDNKLYRFSKKRALKRRKRSKSRHYWK